MKHQIKDYAEIMSGLTLGKVDIEADTNRNQGLYLIRPNDLARDTLLRESELALFEPIVISETVKKRIKDKHYLQPNDIVLTARSTSYHVAMIKEIPAGMHIIMNNNTICIRPSKLVTYPEAILVYLNSLWFRKNVIDVEFPKMLTINVAWVKNLSFTLPDAAFCQRIAERTFEHRNLQQQLNQTAQQARLRLEACLFNQMSEETAHD